ncbi:hypothetical protein OMAG_000692 [Candidatus Omnitrophus magneticus]|uniref:Uncharacterized protein n=1 Tax=Candidatus Omnitrophus magneticus TaxID=1609969 RepID=A0A0F0CQ45_9BACT|nr:hypothetical protein OMAG_000692 [Candidatus Omnitrophus magneticus]
MGNDYKIRSERETCYGRADIFMIPRDKKRIGFVIGFNRKTAFGHR